MGKVKTLFNVIGSMAAGAAAGAIVEGIKQEKRIDVYEDEKNKFICFYNLTCQWIGLKQDGKCLDEYFKFNGYKKIAIYGMSDLGKLLVSELKDTDIEIVYCVDKNKDNICTSIPCYIPTEELPEVDVMVVSAIYYYQDIEEEMGKKVKYPIISLEDVVYGLA